MYKNLERKKVQTWLPFRILLNGEKKCKIHKTMHIQELLVKNSYKKINSKFVFFAIKLSRYLCARRRGAGGVLWENNYNQRTSLQGSCQWRMCWWPEIHPSGVKTREFQTRSLPISTLVSKSQGIHSPGTFTIGIYYIYIYFFFFYKCIINISSRFHKNQVS